MDFECPQCQSLNIKSLHYGRKIGGAIGMIAGIVCGILSVCGKAKVKIIFGISAALLEAIREGTAGCTIGIMLGDIVDNVMLDNYKCLSCGHYFSNNRNENNERNEQY